MSKRAHQRQMAINEVDMRMGTYPYKDGKPRLDRSGAHKVVQVELLRSVGLSVQYQNKGKALFEDEWYKEQVALELARRQESFKTQALKADVSLTNLGLLMFQELWLRVSKAPSTISTEMLLRYAPKILITGLELDARAEAKDIRKPVSPTQLFAQQMVYIDGEKGQEIIDQLTDHNDDRKEQIHSLVRARNALEREIVDGVDDEAVNEGTA